MVCCPRPASQSLLASVVLCQSACRKKKRWEPHSYDALLAPFRHAREAVKKGNKIFGAAILKLSDLSLVVVGTNTEIESPLWHGEVSDHIAVVGSSFA